MKLEINCFKCGKIFLRDRNEVNRSKRKRYKNYCPSCKKDPVYTGKSFACGECGTIIYRRPADIRDNKSNIFFCNRTCSSIYRGRLMRGENHPNYTDSKWSYRNKALNHYDHKCQLCGYDKIEILLVHHIDGNRDNSSINNLIILCRNCHHEIHLGITKLTL